MENILYKDSQKSQPIFHDIIAVFGGILFFVILVKIQPIVFVVFVMILFITLFFVSVKRAFLFLIFVRPLIDMYWDKPLLFSKNPLYLIGVVTIFLIMLYLLTKKISFLQIPYSKLIVIFLLCQFISYLYSGAQFPALVNIAKISTGFLFFFAIPFIFRTREDINRLIHIILLSTVIPLLVSFYIWYMGGPGIFDTFLTGEAEIHRGVMIQFRGLERLSGLYQGTFNISFYCLIVIFFGILKFRDIKDPIIKGLLLIYMLFSLFILLQTYLRTAWIMAIIGLGIWLVFEKKKVPVILLITVVILSFLFSKEIQLRFADEISFVAGQANFEVIGSGRGSQWMRYKNIFDYDFSFPEKILGRMGVIGRPENLFLYLMVQSGILGLISYIVLMSGITLGLIRSFFKLDGFLKYLCILTFVFHIAFIISGMSGVPILWVNSQAIIWSLIGVVFYQFQRAKAADKKTGIY